mmetsp:Transcript_28312/g.61601  ORF Transcript_28312/g.61601 Transcript_28312/m.61601 type:complete len:218 (+) Transcript_28312:265-918(+)
MDYPSGRTNCVVGVLGHVYDVSASLHSLLRALLVGSVEGAQGARQSRDYKLPCDRVLHPGRDPPLLPSLSATIGQLSLGALGNRSTKDPAGICRHRLQDGLRRLVLVGPRVSHARVVVRIPIVGRQSKPLAVAADLSPLSAAPLEACAEEDGRMEHAQRLPILLARLLQMPSDHQLDVPLDGLYLGDLRRESHLWSVLRLFLGRGQELAFCAHRHER